MLKTVSSAKKSLMNNQEISFLHIFFANALLEKLRLDLGIPFETFELGQLLNNNKLH